MVLQQKYLLSLIIYFGIWFGFSGDWFLLGLQWFCIAYFAHMSGFFANIKAIRDARKNEFEWVHKLKEVDNES